MTGVSGGFSRERGEIHMPRHMSLVDNTPLAVADYVDHMVDTGQVALQSLDDGRLVSAEEAKLNLKKLFTAMAQAHPGKILESFPYAAHDPIKHVSPSRTFPNLLGYQFRFLIRDALPVAELTDINDRYLKGRRNFLGQLAQQYEFPAGILERPMTAFDEDCQGPNPPGPNEMFGRFRAAIVPMLHPGMPDHRKQHLLQQLYEGTQIEVISACWVARSANITWRPIRALLPAEATIPAIGSYDPFARCTGFYGMKYWRMKA